MLSIQVTHTDIISKLKWSWSENQVQIVRFVKIPITQDNIDKIMLLDLGSLKQTEKEKKNFLTGNQEKTTNLTIGWYPVTGNDIDEFIGQIKAEPEPFIDDYKINCFKCNKLTDIAEWSHVNSFMGLGKSYCSTCKIRYSASGSQWICCQLNESNVFCSSSLNEFGLCTKSHSTTMKLQAIRVSEKSVKYPYKRTINLNQVNI